MDFKKLAPEQKQAYLADIERALTSRRLYLKSNFSLADLAEETGIKLHNLSYLINSEKGLSFSDYMHLWRIRHFKERLNDSEWKRLNARKNDSGLRI
jgi:YesN/AraC family two-component response regulator